MEASTFERPFAIITGASTGIGLELAKRFAENGYDLLICSQSDEIENAQEELMSYGVNVDYVQVNLATFKGVEELFAKVDELGRDLDSLVINAGVGIGGDFTETNLNEEIALINLNNISAVHLTKRLLPKMYEQGFGKILFTASISSIMPSPFEAVYGASKAFTYSFAESIRNEAKDHGVSVTILMPGPTNTNFFHRAHMDDTKAGAKDKFTNDPAEVARQGFEALMAGKEKVVSESIVTKLQGWASQILPERIKAEFHRKMSEPGSAH